MTTGTLDEVVNTELVVRMELVVLVMVLVETEAVEVGDEQVCAVPKPGLNGDTSTLEKSIQLVVRKKLPSWNWTTEVSVSCSEKLAREQIELPGP